jgi:hypothetical protein
LIEAVGTRVGKEKKKFRVSNQLMDWSILLLLLLLLLCISSDVRTYQLNRREGEMSEKREKKGRQKSITKKSFFFEKKGFIPFFLFHYIISIVAK